jgi:hypothetical protein
MKSLVERLDAQDKKIKELERKLDDLLNKNKPQLLYKHAHTIDINNDIEDSRLVDVKNQFKR